MKYIYIISVEISFFFGESEKREKTEGEKTEKDGKTVFAP